MVSEKLMGFALGCLMVYGCFMASLGKDSIITAAVVGGLTSIITGIGVKHFYVKKKAK
jgi:hypothetical protein